MRLFASILVTCALAGCGRDDRPVQQPNVPAGKAAITGTVRFVGEISKPRPIPGADCHLGGPPLVDESVMVNDAGDLRNVIVYVKNGPAVDLPGGMVVMDQANCRFAPHVVAVRTSQTLRFSSSDPTIHNVLGQCEANTPFNFALTAAGQSRDMTFDRPEIFAVRCNVHPWMVGYVGVFDHPLFAVTGEDGQFKIQGLPPGTYTLAAWQEHLGTREKPVTATDGAVNVDFEFGK